MLAAGPAFDAIELRIIEKKGGTEGCGGKAMLRITQKQMDLLDAACFRRNAIGFVAGELRLFDDVADPANVAAGFDHLSDLLDMKSRHDRLTVVLLLLGKGAFGETFTEHAIVRLMAVSCSPEQRQELVHDALRKHGYDADFVRRQTWV